jgi:DNA (cytosine-5)-methyltransferase 1
MEKLDAGFQYLKEARKTLTQREIATFLGRDVRTVKRWEARQVSPPKYVVPALQQLLFSTRSATPPLFGDFSFIDLFAGIGGIRLAFEDIGGQCVFSSEWDKYAQKTYLANFYGADHMVGDITEVSEDDIPDHDVLLAGFPCQPFSIAGVSKKNALGHAHGFADETQGTLFFDVARIIARKRPRIFLLENVKNLRSHDKGRTFQVIQRILSEDLGYVVHYNIVDGGHFVPQHRERLIILGFREPVAFDWQIINLPPKKTHKLSDILHRTDGTELVIESDEGRYFDHASRHVNPKFTLTDHLWNYLQSYAEKHRAKGNGFGFGLVGPQDTARTLSARYYKDGSEILIKQASGSNPRRLTPRECARLMGFPDTFKIPVSDTRAYKQFGNSVVVPVIREMARVLRPFICDPQYQYPELPQLIR